MCSPIPEVRERIRCAEAAWRKLGSFWSRSSISIRFRITAYKARVRSVLLTGLETVAFSYQLLQPLEVFQMKCLRKLMCGKACLKTLMRNRAGEESTKYKALSNQEIRQRLRIHTVSSELRYRRLSWLQSLASSGSKASSTFAALCGTTVWEQSEELDRDGNLSSSSNPWLRQFFQDLQILAKNDERFRKTWKAKKFVY